MKEFNLSECIVDDPRSEHVGYIHAPWVKEFIKLSNQDLDEVMTGKMSISKFIRRFKQRAGDKLK